MSFALPDGNIRRPLPFHDLYKASDVFTWHSEHSLTHIFTLMVLSVDLFFTIRRVEYIASSLLVSLSSVTLFARKEL